LKSYVAGEQQQPKRAGCLRFRASEQRVDRRDEADAQQTDIVSSIWSAGIVYGESQDGREKDEGESLRYETIIRRNWRARLTARETDSLTVAAR
jgi:hypothetical protein